MPFSVQKVGQRISPREEAGPCDRELGDGVALADARRARLLPFDQEAAMAARSAKVGSFIIK